MNEPARNYPHGVMFHRFHGGRHTPGQGSISADDLERIIVHYGPHRFLSPDEWIEKSQANTLQSDDMCLTLDDGLRSQYDIALPVLERYNLRAFWFVYTSPLTGAAEDLEVHWYFQSRYFDTTEAFYSVFFSRLADYYEPAFMQRAETLFNQSNYRSEFSFYSRDDRRFRYYRDIILGATEYRRVMNKIIEEYALRTHTLLDHLWMNSSHLQSLHRAGHRIGLHSHNHPTRIDLLSQPEMTREYQQNYDIVTEVTGEAPVAVSHPCNSYSVEIMEFLRTLGIRVGFRANCAQKNHSRLEFPREDHANIMRFLNEQ